MPTTVLVDRRGVVRHVHTGFRPSDVETYEEWITLLLSEGEDASEPDE
jgi:hypothetical protein